jgi:hypothetical protein
VAPATSSQAPFGRRRCHCSVGVGRPAATTENDAPAPATTAIGAGMTLNDGAAGRNATETRCGAPATHGSSTGYA